MVKVESKHFVKIRITSREWCGSTHIHHTITARFCPHKKANEPKARAASSLSGIRLKKVDEKKSKVAVFRSMARGLTISVSRDKIGKPPSPPVDITTACSNNFRFEASWSEPPTVSLPSFGPVELLLLRTKIDTYLRRYFELHITFVRIIFISVHHIIINNT